MDYNRRIVMNSITKDQVKDYVVNGLFTIKGTTSADEDSKKAKEGVTFTFAFNCKDVPLSEIIADALSQKKITKQAIVRKHPELYKAGETYTYDYTGRVGRTPVDPKQSTKDYLASLTPKLRLQWLKEQGLI
jgi:hypothetical protein